ALHDGTPALSGFGDVAVRRADAGIVVVELPARIAHQAFDQLDDIGLARPGLPDVAGAVAADDQVARFVQRGGHAGNLQLRALPITRGAARASRATAGSFKGGGALTWSVATNFRSVAKQVSAACGLSHGQERNSCTPPCRPSPVSSPARRVLRSGPR